MCGDPAVNPATLGMRWCLDEDSGTVIGSFFPHQRHVGYANRLHGGILTALFDECLAWACALRCGAFCLTGELTVRFRSAVTLGETIEFRGWTVDRWGGYLRAVGEASSPAAVVLASAHGTYSQISRDESLLMRGALRFANGDVDVLRVPTSQGHL